MLKVWITGVGIDTGNRDEFKNHVGVEMAGLMIDSALSARREAKEVYKASGLDCLLDWDSSNQVIYYLTHPERSSKDYSHSVD